MTSMFYGIFTFVTLVMDQIRRAAVKSLEMPPPKINMTSPRDRPNVAASCLDFQMSGRKHRKNIDGTGAPVWPFRYRGQFSFIYEEVEQHQVAERLMRRVLHFDATPQNVNTKNKKETGINEAKTPLITPEKNETLSCLPEPEISEILKKSRKPNEVSKDCNVRCNPPVISGTESKVAALRKFFDGINIQNTISTAGVVQTATPRPSSQYDDNDMVRYDTLSAKKIITLERENEWLLGRVNELQQELNENRQIRSSRDTKRMNKRHKLLTSKVDYHELGSTTDESDVSSSRNIITSKEIDKVMMMVEELILMEARLRVALENQISAINDRLMLAEMQKEMRDEKKKYKWLLKEMDMMLRLTREDDDEDKDGDEDEVDIDEAIKMVKKLKGKIVQLIAVQNDESYVRKKLEKTNKKLKAEKNKSKLMFKTLWPNI